MGIVTPNAVILRRLVNEGELPQFLLRGLVTGETELTGRFREQSFFIRAVGVMTEGALTDCGGTVQERHSRRRVRMTLSAGLGDVRGSQ